MPDAQLPLFPEIEPEFRNTKTLVVPEVQAVRPEVQLVEDVSPAKRPAKAHVKKRQNGAGKARAKPYASKAANDLLTVRDVARQCTVSRATIWRWVKSANGFPQPLRMAPGTTRWRLQDVVAWQATCAGAPTGGVN